MPNVATVLKEEITRLARKEVKAQFAITKKAGAQYRRDIASLKREVKDLKRQIADLQRGRRRAGTKAPASTGADTKQIRFSPDWVANHREKLGLSRADYAELVGVSGLTIYNWETARTRPRDQQLRDWWAIRQLGKREALRRLED